PEARRQPPACWPRSGSGTTARCPRAAPCPPGWLPTRAGARECGNRWQMWAWFDPGMQYDRLCQSFTKSALVEFKTLHNYTSNNNLLLMRFTNTSYTGIVVLPDDRGLRGRRRVRGGAFERSNDYSTGGTRTHE